MWAMNVVPDIWCASVANSASCHAAIGSLCSSGRPGVPNTPMPVPSGFLLLCSDGLSGASTSQNVAVQTCVPVCRPKSRHMGQTVPNAVAGSAQSAGKCPSNTRMCHGIKPVRCRHASSVARLNDLVGILGVAGPDGLLVVLAHAGARNFVGKCPTLGQPPSNDLVREELS